MQLLLGLKNICHPLPLKVRKSALILTLLAGWLITPSQANAQSCTSFPVDLSASVNASWSNPEYFTPSGQCCGVSAGTQCFSYEVTLHPGANAVVINLLRQGGSWGQVNYYVDCMNFGPVYENDPVTICLDGPGPHTITFCRTATTTATFLGHLNAQNYTPNVTLEPFDHACTADDMILLTGGYPSGGSYYIDGAQSFWLEPGEVGPGSYEVTYVYGGPGATCAATATQTITVNQTPTVTVSDMTFCDESGLIPLHSGQPAGGDYFGTFVSANLFDTDLSSPGSYDITYRYTTPEGCPAEDQAQVHIDPLPPVNAGGDITIPQSTSAPLNAVGANTSLYQYSWSPSAYVQNPDQPNTNTIALTQSQLFTLTVTNPNTGCQSTDQMAVFVSGGQLSVVHTVASETTICQQDSVNLFVLPTGGSGSYIIDWYDYTAVPPQHLSDDLSFWHIPDVTTTYQVQVLDVANPNGRPVTRYITVEVIPLPVVTLEPFDPVCGNETYYELTGASPDGGYFSLPTMNIHNITSVNPLELGEGFHTISYTVVEGNCRSIQSQYLEVYPRPLAKFYAQQDFCQMNEVTFLNLSENTNDFVWQIGTEATVTNPADPFQYNFSIPDVTRLVPVTLTATNTDNGCTDNRTRIIEVIPPTIARFNVIDQDLIGCAPYPVKFTNQTTGPVAFYLWDFGDGSFSTQTDPQHIFTNHTDQNITFTVILSAMSGNFMCLSRDTIEVTVRPFLEAGFGLMPVTACSPYEAEIFNNALGLNITETWNYGDGTPGFNSSDTILQHTFNNNTADPLTYIISQIVTNPQGCADTMQVEIEVYPFLESDFRASVNEGCAPLTVTFTDESGGAAYNYFYDFDDGGTSEEKNPVHTFENQTDQTITYTVMQVASNDNFCYDTTYVDIVVHPEVKAGFDFMPAVVCAPHQTNITNTSSGNINSWSWTLNENGVTTPLGNTSQLDHVFQNPGPDPIDYILILEVGNEQGCISRKELPITVNPEVTAMFTASDTTGCQPLAIDFSNQSANAHTYLWEFGDGGSSSQENPGHVFENQNYSTMETYTVSLYAESSFMCNDTRTMEIELYPAVEALFTVDTAKGCSPFTVNIAHASRGASLFAWDFGDGSAPSTEGGASLTHTFTNTTDQPVTHQLTLVVESPFGCMDTLERTITVYPEVQSAFTSVTEGCHPLSVNFTNNSSATAHYFSWEFGEEGYSAIANPAYTFNNSSHTENLDYQVSLRAESIYGCHAISTETITVHPVPDPSFLLSDLAGCTPFDLEITNQSEGATSHYWTFGDGEFSTEGGGTISHTYTLAPGNDMQTIDIQLLVSNDYGCADSLTHQLTLYPQIVSAFEASILDGCHPLTVEFTNLSEGASAYANYFWNYGDGFESTTGQGQHSHTFLNQSYTDPVTYTVELMAMNANACSDVQTLEITVQPAPLTTFNISDPVGCSPHDFVIDNASLGGTSYVWDFGDGSPAMTNNDLQIPYGYQNPAGNDPAQYIIHLEGTNDLGCTRSYEQVVVVYPEVEAAFASEIEGCHPLNVDFENLSVGATNTLWNFGEGNNSQQLNPTHLFLNHSYTEPESFVVTLYSENDWGCSDLTTDTITVLPLPLSNFDLLSRSGCSPFSTEIYNLAEGALNYDWDLGNATYDGSDSAFSHTWHNTTGAPLHYSLWLNVENEFGCVDQSMQSITVYPEVQADFTTSDGVVEGCSPFEVQFVNQSELTQEYVWDFGDSTGTAGANPWHAFTNEGPDNAVFTVQMEGTSLFGCKDTTWLDITVFPSPLAKFDATPKIQVYPSRTISLDNLSKPGYWNYHWSFGDGNGQETTSPDTFDYTYGEWDISDLSTRTFTIDLEVENQGCTSSYSQEITITSPVPLAQFSPSAQGCAPFDVQFYNLSQHAHSYLWTFGDGSFSIDEEPHHLFMDPGLYEIQLVAYGDGGSDTTYQYVTVHANPVADFSLVKPLIEIPYEPLEVLNHSVGADFYHWDFGDGNTSVEFEPVHWYQYPNTYTITLAVATDTQPQCFDTLQLDNALLVQTACTVVFPNAFTPQESGPHGGACDPYDLDNTTFEVFYPKMDPNMGEMKRYELEIFNRWGELIFYSDDPYVGWDGYYRGQLGNTDVYVWKFSGVCSNGKPLNMVGDVTLVR
ncbi:MAG: PKD domain-containing protein [Bacteroides sp.]|jgi:PKD repeat protein|nr:PKD domain-containing protein [Bacteroides sp.]